MVLHGSKVPVSLPHVSTTAPERTGMFQPIIHGLPIISVPGLRTRSRERNGEPQILKVRARGSRLEMEGDN